MVDVTPVAKQEKYRRAAVVFAKDNIASTYL